jgi:DNA-binding MarR family transcriptional regulator
MVRTHGIARLYDELAAFARRARWLSTGLHPGLSLVAYTLLSHAAGEPDVRAADLAERYALDKSSVSRQIALLEQGERPGRRGHVLEVTPAGHELLDAAASSLRERLADRLASWSDKDVALLA